MTVGSCEKNLQIEVTDNLFGCVRKMFRTRVIFGGTMDNYISMERLWNVEFKYMKIWEI